MRVSVLWTGYYLFLLLLLCVSAFGAGYVSAEIVIQLWKGRN